MVPHISLSYMYVKCRAIKGRPLRERTHLAMQMRSGTPFRRQLVLLGKATVAIRQQYTTDAIVHGHHHQQEQQEVEEIAIDVRVNLKGKGCIPVQ